LANHGRSGETLRLIDAARAKQKIGLDIYPYVASSTILKKDRVALSARTLITWSDRIEGLEGRDIEEVAADMGLTLDDTIDAISPAGAIYFLMDDADVKAIMAYPATMIGSDGLCPMTATPTHACGAHSRACLDTMPARKGCLIWQRRCTK
jgi:N-acyl-D-amino-acid deacylase